MSNGGEPFEEPRALQPPFHRSLEALVCSVIEPYFQWKSGLLRQERIEGFHQWHRLSDLGIRRVSSDLNPK